MAALDKARLKARMLIQVHDELVFEAPDGAVDETNRVAKGIMVGPSEPAVRLSVP